jgi:hypothetical protein
VANFELAAESMASTINDNMVLLALWQGGSALDASAQFFENLSCHSLNA